MLDNNQASGKLGKDVVVQNATRVRAIVSLSLLAWTIAITTLFLSKNTVLLHVFFYIFQPWHIWLGNCPWFDIILAALIFSLYWLTGHLILRSCNVFFSLFVDIGIAFVIGISVLTIPFELLAIAGLLYRIPVALIFILFIGILFYSACRHNKETLPGSDSPLNPRLFRARYLVFARHEYNARIQKPCTTVGILAYYAAVFLIALNIILNFYHALFFPETYWDALIYYMGYSRLTYMQHMFPVKVVAQVGIGLGANYPHLFPLMGATIATLAGTWSNIFPQMISPVAGLITTALIYSMISRISRNALIAILATLLFRSVPYVIAYFTFASDYSLTLLYLGAFLYLSMMYLESRLWGYLMLNMLLCAGAVHINYLMWYLWIGLIILLVLAHTGKRKKSSIVFIPGDLPLTVNTTWLPIGKFVRQRRFLVFLFVTLAMASTWYIRNIIVTGNPVYAFFPEIFDGKHINPQVLESCFVEWRLNGDGIGVFGTSIAAKIAATWRFFVTWEHSWKLAPVFVAFGVSGFILAFLSVSGIFSVRCNFQSVAHKRLLVLSLYIFLFLLLYHYCISDIYLYHIVAILVPVSVSSTLVLTALWGRGFKIIIILLCLIIGIIPGIAFSLRGFKALHLNLVALRNPCMPPQHFYRLRFDDDVAMWNYVNEHLRGEKLLTHENRHLMYHPSITFIHLDDWDIQRLYNLQDHEKMNALKSMGIRHYLYIPMEEHHPILKKLGVYRWTQDETLMELLFERGDNRLYRFKQ